MTSQSGKEQVRWSAGIKTERPRQLNRSVGMEKRAAKGMQAACFYTFWEEGGWEYYHGGGKTVESRRQVEGMKAQKSDSGAWVRKAAPFYITEQRGPWNMNSGCPRRLTSNTHFAVSNGYVSVPVSLISSVQHLPPFPFPSLGRLPSSTKVSSLPLRPTPSQSVIPLHWLWNVKVPWSLVLEAFQMFSCPVDPSTPMASYSI